MLSLPTNDLAAAEDENYSQNTTTTTTSIRREEDYSKLEFDVEEAPGRSSKANVASSILTTLLNNGRIELAKEVEEEDLRSSNGATTATAAMDILNTSKSNCKQQESDKCGETGNKTVGMSPATANTMTKISSKYQKSDVYIV